MFRLLICYGLVYCCDFNSFVEFVFSQPKRSAGRSPGGEFVCVCECVFWWIEVLFFVNVRWERWRGEEAS